MVTIPLILNILSTFSALVLAWVAWRGITTWKNEVKYKHLSELVEKLIRYESNFIANLYECAVSYHLIELSIDINDGKEHVSKLKKYLKARNVDLESSILFNMNKASLYSLKLETTLQIVSAIAPHLYENVYPITQSLLEIKDNLQQIQRALCSNSDPNEASEYLSENVGVLIERNIKKLHSDFNNQVSKYYKSI